MAGTSAEFELQVERIALVLAALPIRGTASYSELSAAAGQDVQRFRFALIEARKRVEKATGLRLETVREIGIKKLDGEAVKGIGQRARGSIARKAKRQGERLAGLKYNDLTAADRLRLDAERSVLGAIEMAARVDIRRTEKRVASGPIPAAKLFAAMGKES
jgi:hypothetical protein